MRAVLELVLTIIAIIVARAILTSLMRGVGNAARTSTASPASDQNQARTQSAPESQPTGELHKDPVCGTYVAESTPFHRQIAGKMFYYCSGACKEKHALVTK
jgi:YHS domain-containing protein